MTFSATVIWKDAAGNWKKTGKKSHRLEAVRQEIMSKGGYVLRVEALGRGKNVPRGEIRTKPSGQIVNVLAEFDVPFPLQPSYEPTDYRQAAVEFLKSQGITQKTIGKYAPIRVNYEPSFPTDVRIPSRTIDPYVDPNAYENLVRQYETIMATYTPLEIKNKYLKTGTIPADIKNNIPVPDDIKKLGLTGEYKRIVYELSIGLLDEGTANNQLDNLVYQEKNKQFEIERAKMQQPRTLSPEEKTRLMVKTVKYNQDQFNRGISGSIGGYPVEKDIRQRMQIRRP